MAIVISAFPACGKSYVFKNSHMATEKVILDSDSSKFSWVVNENGEKVRNPEFPANYIQHIKDNLNTADIIFVSSHLNVRQAMTDAGIGFVTVYPKVELMNEWLGRCYVRGSDSSFLEFIKNSWNKFMLDLPYEPTGAKVYRLNAGQYLGDILDEIVFENTPAPSLPFLRDITADIQNVVNSYKKEGYSGESKTGIWNKGRHRDSIPWIGGIIVNSISDADGEPQMKVSVEIFLHDISLYYRKVGYEFIKKMGGAYYMDERDPSYVARAAEITKKIGLSGTGKFNTYSAVMSEDTVGQLFYTIDVN